MLNHPRKTCTDGLGGGTEEARKVGGQRFGLVFRSREFDKFTALEKRLDIATLDMYKPRTRIGVLEMIYMYA